MSSVIWHVTMSLDGFIAGRDDSMDWVVAQWSDGGENTRDIDVQRSAVADEVLHSAGAILGGRRWYDVAVGKFDGYEGIYGGQWTGPVFVLTHRPPGADHHPAITFLSDDLRDAVATAAGAAAGKDVIVFGANLALQCLRAGLLDEIVIHLVPVLLGDGVRLIGTPNLSLSPLNGHWLPPLVRSPTCGSPSGAEASLALSGCRRSERLSAQLLSCMEPAGRRVLEARAPRAAYVRLTSKPRTLTSRVRVNLVPATLPAGS